MNTWQKLALAGLLLVAGRVHAEDIVHYYYTDPQGTVLARTDATGNVIASYDYAPYGSQALGTPPNGPGYTGHVNDPDTGLVYMKARYYDPERGGFLSVDPVGPSPGNAFSFNRYGYADNNPVVNMDADGKMTGRLTDPDGVGVAGPGYTMFVNSNNHGGGSASHSIPRNTPNSMKQYFEKSDPKSKVEATVATMDYFGIDHAGVTCCNLVKGNTVNAEMNFNGQLDIGNPLFLHSFGMIGAILYHEVGVHWDLQYSRGAHLDGMYTQAWYMREIQAYDLETNKTNSHRFGLTPAEINEERVERSGYLTHLTPWNRESVEQGYYKP